MPTIPSDGSLDSTLALTREGYAFISSRCDALGSDVFETRLMGQKVICMRGEEAARLFYDIDRFERHGAAPERVQKTLLGTEGVQTLDGDAHRHRKALFLRLLGPERGEALVAEVRRQWERALERWEHLEEVELYDEVNQLLCRAVFAWAGVPLPEADVVERTWEMTAMIEGSGRVGVKHRLGRVAREQAEGWVEELVAHTRSGQHVPPPNSPLALVAQHRDLDGEPLAVHEAAVTLLNLLRPTVAVGRYVVFVAHALHAHPAIAAQLADGDARYTEHFVHEVRRFYPFFPFAAAQVRKDFLWNGYRFPKGRRVLLDLYGTNHHPALWQEPSRFEPERFARWGGSAYDFVPQGGGEHAVHHRCPGEDATIAIMTLATDFLVRRMRYEVPPQDLTLSLRDMPTLPASRFRMRNVRQVHDEAAA